MYIISIEEQKIMECRPDAVGMEKYTVTQKTRKKTQNPCCNWVRIVRVQTEI